MTKEELDLEAEKMSWDEQNWLFNRLMDRLWPDLAGQKAAFQVVSSDYEDDGYTEEDYEWYRQKAEEIERKLAEGECDQ
jgi:hypothetical protein